jgi:hypothetical protein
MHYAVPRQLCARGLLERFCVDICAMKGWPRLLRLAPHGALPRAAVRLSMRVPEGVPTRLITAFTRFGLAYQRRRERATSATEMTRTHLWAGETFCALVNGAGLQKHTSLYCYNSAGLECLKAWKREGQFTVLEQTSAPREIEERILLREEARFPGWEEKLEVDGPAREFAAREKEEWKWADLVVCGSEFVRECVIAAGGPGERCIVVPYGVGMEKNESVRRAELAGRKLRVLTVGAVGLQKGSPYVLQAAKALAGRVDFRMVGPVRALSERQSELRRHIEIAGVVPRDWMGAHYQWADVFLLPSLCEGSATVTYEALSAGLPVITTRSTGSVIEHAVNGFIVGEGDADAIVEKIEFFLQEPRRLAEFSAAASGSAHISSETAYAERLVVALGAGRR